jgi:hypothetical protein
LRKAGAGFPAGGTNAMWSGRVAHAHRDGDWRLTAQVWQIRVSSMENRCVEAGRCASGRRSTYRWRDPVRSGTESSGVGDSSAIDRLPVGSAPPRVEAGTGPCAATGLRHVTRKTNLSQWMPAWTCTAFPGSVRIDPRRFDVPRQAGKARRHGGHGQEYGQIRRPSSPPSLRRVARHRIT